ncbi:MAG: hypothetical protein F6K50_33680 [Moorea sp. SIO3I7]|nr:hypothetical protein [Moorena sp. SIO3I7]NEQ56981.1 hypothetical protein [Moorena sp. SIO4A1]
MLSKPLANLINRSEPLPTLHLALWWAVLSKPLANLINRSEPLPTLHEVLCHGLVAQFCLSPD